MEEETKKQFKLIASYESILTDLDSVQKWLKVIIRIQENDPDLKDSTVLSGLFIAILITYARCFTSGKREILQPEEIYNGLKGDPLGLHRYLIDMRNKHIAHSVNSFEQIQIGVFISDKKEIFALGKLHSKLIALSKKDFQQIFWLVSEAKKFVISERDLLQKELETKILGKKLEDVEINDLKEMGIKIPGPEDIAIPR